MNTVVANQKLLSELEKQINDAESQKTRIDEYISDLRACYKGTKTYLQVKPSLKNHIEPTDIKPINEAKAVLTMTTSSAFPLSGRDSPIVRDDKSNQTPPEPASQADTNQSSSATTSENDQTGALIVGSPEVNDEGGGESKPAMSDDNFQKLPQFEAMKAVFSAFEQKIPTEKLREELLRRGFKPQAEFFEQSVNSMLRYYESKSIFERDEQNRWGLSSGGGDAAANSGKLPVNNELSNSDCAYEILKNSGFEWMHVDQILTLMKQQYSYERDKDALSSTLRKAAVRGTRFKSFGGNRFGLIDLPPIAKSASA